MTAGVSPALSVVDEILTDVAVGDLSPAHALAELRSRGFTPNREALEDGVRALMHRDDFLAQLGDPYDFLGVGPRPGLDVWATAVAKAEQDYCYAVNQLSKKPAPLAATS
jgi:hypothetical protein